MKSRIKGHSDHNAGPASSQVEARAVRATGAEPREESISHQPVVHISTVTVSWLLSFSLRWGPLCRDVFIIIPEQGRTVPIDWLGINQSLWEVCHCEGSAIERSSVRGLEAELVSTGFSVAALPKHSPQMFICATWLEDVPWVLPGWDFDGRWIKWEGQSGS